MVRWGYLSAMIDRGAARLCFIAACLAGCSSPPAAPLAKSYDAGAVTPTTRDSGASSDAVDSGPCTQPRMDFTGGSGFFGAPFPSDARLTAAGTPDLSGFPNDPPNQIASVVLGMLTSGAHAFGVTSSIYFSFSAALGTAGMSDPHTSLAPTASVFLLDVDASSPSYGKRSPAKGVFLTNGGPYGAANLLAVLPYPGVSLLPATRYAAVVLRTQLDADGRKICAAPEMKALVAGTQPSGMSDAAFAEYTTALAALTKLGVEASALAALTVFTTDAPIVEFEKVAQAMSALPVPQVTGAWTADEVFPTYCVFHNTIPMPDYQGGVPPYSTTGGAWVFDASGTPVLQESQPATIVVTVPRAQMPAKGYPIVNMSSTGAGGNRPLVDRGQAATNGGPAIVPGSGPAMYYAAAGFAGASIDGPLEGLRNPIAVNTHDGEDYTILNVANPPAMRDNIRQSAAELALGASILSSLSFDASSCPGVVTPNGGPVTFDGTTMAIMSHSMGSSISPLAIAMEPRYRAAILSGAGGSWIENVVYKLLPQPVLPAVELLLGISPSSGYAIGEGDPMLNLFQWAMESADPPPYDSRTVHQPTGAPARNVLKVQGIIDHYILPPICNATTLSLGLDLAGPALDAMNPGLSTYTPLMDVLDLSGRAQLSLPVGGNVTTGDGGVVTAVVTQHPSDGIEDGHEVIFQTDAPKHEYVCMLQALAAGTTIRIPADGAAISPCD
jgi:hypothetical protein